MQELAPAQPAPDLDDIIKQVSPAITKLIESESSDESDDGRIWILRKVRKADLYFRDLENYAPSFYQGIIDATSTTGTVPTDGYGGGDYDYTQNHYRGFCRKLEGVLGTRMPNVAAVPDNAADDKDVKAASEAQNAADYVNQECQMQKINLLLVFKSFLFGTVFGFVDWVEDGNRYGYDEIPQMGVGQQSLGGSGYDCPSCGASNPAGPMGEPPPQCQSCGAPMEGAQFRPETSVPIPQQVGTQLVPKGGLQISIHDASEVAVPLDSETIDSPTTRATVPWLRWEREQHKSILFSNEEWGERLEQSLKNKQGGDVSGVPDTVSSEYGVQVRTSMASPIGITRPARENRPTVVDLWLPSQMYKLMEGSSRKVMQENFAKGVRIMMYKGRIFYMKKSALADHWVECKPEPSQRIMGDGLGDDFIVSQDISNNGLNQMYELVSRSNEADFVDVTRVDVDAMERQRDTPGGFIPMLPRAGMSLADSIYRREPRQFSEQIPNLSNTVVENAKTNSGLVDDVWGGDSSDPTARQTELKMNAALRQLGVLWKMIGQFYEQIYKKSCRLLAEHQEGVIKFSKKNQFGKYDQMAVDVESLRNGNYHFEADEAIPLTYGQQRDLLMWFLDRSPEQQQFWGMNDPLNVPTFKRLLGMPGERIPNEDSRDKGMAIIEQLLAAAPTPGAPDLSAPPDPSSGQPPQGPQQPSIAPDWEDDSAFMASLAKSYLTVNYQLKQDKADGYLNVQLWGQAHQQIANQPGPTPPPKASVSIAVKPENIGASATQDILTKSGVLDQGILVQAEAPPPPQFDPNSQPFGPPPPPVM